MKQKIFLSALLSIAAPALAGTPITYDALLKGSGGDSSPKTLMGRTIVVAATGNGDLGFFTKQGKELSFVCKSGDKSLTSMKAKPTTFSGTTVSAQGWEGATVWTLSDCQPSQPVAGATMKNKAALK